MIEKLYKFTCKDCKFEDYYPDKDDTPRSIGWAIARDGKTCYCPACAPNHRSTGCGGAKVLKGKQIMIGESNA